MTTKSEVLSYPGQVTYKKITLVTGSKKTYDIRNMAMQISIFEDIFSPVMTGSILIEDGLDFLYNLPLIGEEFIEIEFQTPSMSPDHIIKRTFFIYKVCDVEILHDNTLRYVMHLISPEAMVDSNKKVSRKFNGRISTSVVELMKSKFFLESDRELASEETANNLSYISNYWTPIENINYLTQRALSLDSNHPSFLFFESNKRFMFVSMQKLMRQPSFCEYSFSKKTRAKASGGSVKDNDAQMKKILSLSSAKVFDYLDRNQGMYGGKLLTHNILTKTIKTTTYDLFSSWNEKDHLEKYPLNTNKIPYTKASGLMFRDNIHYVYEGQISDKFQLWLLERRSILSQMKAVVFDAEVNGRTDIEVGKVVTVDMPISQIINASDSKTEVKNKRYSGRFLISAIHHRFYNGHHRMNLQLVKDSFGDKL